MLSLCDYSDAYIPVTGNTTVAGDVVTQNKSWLRKMRISRLMF